jgi:hypothetical protein
MSSEPRAEVTQANGDTRSDADLLRLIARDHERLAPNAYHSAETLRQIADRLAAQPSAEVERMREAVENFAEGLENADYDGVTRGCLNTRQCCSGHECGCFGSTVGQWLAYCLRSILTTPAPSVEPDPLPAPDDAVNEKSPAIETAGLYRSQPKDGPARIAS